MPLGIGPLELIIVLLIVVFVFGAGKLPEVGAGLGRGIREFKDSITGRSDTPDEKDTNTPELKA